MTQTARLLMPCGHDRAKVEPAEQGALFGGPGTFEPGWIINCAVCCWSGWSPTLPRTKRRSLNNRQEGLGLR